MPVIQREIRQRGFFGHVFKWLFVIFNVLMLVWMIAYWKEISPMVGEGGGAYKAGANVGAVLGTGMLAFLWVAGDVVLGMFVLFTRGGRS